MLPLAACFRTNKIKSPLSYGELLGVGSSRIGRPKPHSNPQPITSGSSTKLQTSFVEEQIKKSPLSYGEGVGGEAPDTPRSKGWKAAFAKNLPPKALAQKMFERNFRRVDTSRATLYNWAL